MIHTAMQIRAKIRNLSGGDSRKSQTLIRNYVMERFLERMSVSKYRSQFVLKGGMLVASIVGLETRATLDIDATVRALALNEENANRIITDIISIELPGGFRFRIMSEKEIMDEADYPGIRFMLEAAIDNMVQPLKIDISTGDVITPGAVEYNYPLMLEDRTISIMTYNTETLLAEKLETILSRGLANTRMRDFYDITVIREKTTYNAEHFKEAFHATSLKRGTLKNLDSCHEILKEIRENETMRNQWENYCRQSYFVGNISWDEANDAVPQLADLALTTV